jgi:hypothetical protein
MTRILSAQTLKQLRSSTLTSPTKKVAHPPKRTNLADDGFMHGPTRNPKLADDGFMYVPPRRIPTPTDGFIDAPAKRVSTLADDVLIDVPPKRIPTPTDDVLIDVPPKRIDDRVETTSPGDRVIELATSVLGQNAHDLKLANDTELGAAMQDGVGDTVNCANFVSGLLTATGQIPKSEGDPSVVNLVANLRKDPNFTKVSLDDASPGDVVAFEYTKHGKKGHHVVVFEGRDENGTPKFIGSNNVNKDHTQRISHSTGYNSSWDVMAVMHYTGQ